MIYLIKVSFAWGLFLLLFELLYKRNGRYAANRVYLLLSIAIGLLLPFISLPAMTPASLNAVRGFYNTIQIPNITAVKALPQAAVAVVSPVRKMSTPQQYLPLIAGIIYGMGVLLLLIKYLSELVKIRLLIRRNPAQIIYGHKVIVTGKMHSPYSFMGYIFLTNAANLSQKELEYIIRHEAAHNNRKHWLDLWILQAVCMVFWFHPLVWRFRYLLQLQHEYEADAIAANEDRYTYGQFLLHHAILIGVPSTTHSFHSSTIKNRILMLTKNQSRRPGNWKYFLLMPAMLICTFLMAKNSPKVESALKANQLSFKGNVFTWRQSDTLFYSMKTKQAELAPANAKEKLKVITAINDEPVYQNDHLQMQASCGYADTPFVNYIINTFHDLRKNSHDSLTVIVDLSLVVNKEGKIVYYNAHYGYAVNSFDQANGFNQEEIWHAIYGSNDVDTMMDKIISNSPAWKPAMSDGKAVNSFINIRIPGC